MTATSLVRRPTKPARPGARRSDRTGRRIAAAVLAGHGALHLMGVALLWRLAEPGALRYADVLPTAGPGLRAVAGAAWLSAAVLLAAAAALLLARRPAWRPTAGVGAAVSAAVLLPAAAVAPVGLAVDAAVLLAVAWPALAGCLRPGDAT
jgi:hypothetical protein